jgi:alpha-ribazole phosphatase
MEVYLVRHTKPYVEKGVCYGQSDLDVVDSFAEELMNLKLHLPEKIDVVYSSPLKRCYKLASHLTQDGITKDARLMELNFGDWEMKKWDDINQEHLNKWMVDFVNVKVPNGESFTEMYNRIGLFVKDLMADKHQTKVIVTHAGVIRCFVAMVLEIPLKNAFKVPMTYGSVTKINMDKEGCFNNIEYLNKF